MDHSLFLCANFGANRSRDTRFEPKTEMPIGGLNT